VSEATDPPQDDPGNASTERRIAWNTAIRSGGEIIAKLASVAFYVVMARELGEQSFGDFMFALSFASVLMIAAGFGIDDLTIREVARDSSRLDWYLSNGAILKIATSVALLGVAAITVNVGGYSSEARATMYLVGAGVAIETLSWTWHAIFTAYERLDLTALSIIAQRTITAVVGIALILNGAGIVTAAAVFLAGAALQLVISHIQMVRRIRRPQLVVDPRAWRELLRVGIPVGLVGLLLTLLIKLDTVLLSFLSGGDNAEVGFLSAAYRLVEATMFVSWSFAHATLPWLGRRAQSGGPELAQACRLGLKAISMLLVPIGTGLIVLAPQVIDLFYGSQYEEAIVPLRLLGAMSVLYGVNYFAGMTLIALDQPERFRRVALPVVIQNVILNVILIPPLGATGAAISALASGIVLAVLTTLQVRAAVGSFQVLGAFSGPVLAGGVMAVALLLVDLPLVPAALLGAVLYLAMLAAVERAAFREDVELMVRIARRRAWG
jgi:O-antigen/teichoic acid export membrane protein